MAKRKDIEAGSSEPAKADNTPEQAQAKNKITSALPSVESPSISPAEPEPTIEPVVAAEAAIETIAPAPAADIVTLAPATPRRFTFNARHKRHALLAASVAIAAALGAVVGAVASGGFAAPARSDVVRLDETKAMQQSIARLSKEIASLKANVEAANKSAHGQVAKISEQLNRAAGDITGSISTPQTVTPLPAPRPAPRVAVVDARPPARVPVVQDWTIRDTRDGYVYVQSRGDIYRVVLGAPLPGLGPVEHVKRQDGRWMVLTPKGIIVSMRDRRYFEAF